MIKEDDIQEEFFENPFVYNTQTLYIPKEKKQKTRCYRCCCCCEDPVFLGLLCFIVFVLGLLTIVIIFVPTNKTNQTK